MSNAFSTATRRQVEGEEEEEESSSDESSAPPAAVLPLPCASTRPRRKTSDTSSGIVGKSGEELARNSSGKGRRRRLSHKAITVEMSILFCRRIDTFLRVLLV